MSNIIERHGNEKIQVNTLNLEILIGDIFAKCNSKHEVEFVKEVLGDVVDLTSSERMDELNNE